MGRFASALVQAASLLLLARVSPVREFALAAGFLAMATFLQMLSDFGIGTLAIRERARDPDGATAGDALWLYGRLSLGLSLVTTVGLAACGIVLDSRFFALMPLGIWIGAERNADAWLAMWVADGLAARSSLSLFCRRLASLIGFAALIACQVPALLAFSCAYAAAAVAAAILARRALLRSLPRSSPVPSGTLLKQSRPYWLHSAATQARNLDVMLVAVVAGSAQAAFYGLPSRLSGPFRLVTTSLASAVLPAVASANSQAALRRMVKLCAMVWGVTALIYASAALLAPVVLPTLVGTDFDGAIVPLQILLAGLLAASGSSLLSATLQGLGRNRIVASVSLLATLVHLVGVCVGGVLAGAVGAASAGLLSHVVQAGALSGPTIRSVSQRLKEVESNDDS